MRAPRVRLTLRSLIAAVAIVAVVSCSGPVVLDPQRWDTSITLWPTDRDDKDRG